MIKDLAFEAKFWPRISLMLFLQQLAKPCWQYLPAAWKSSIVAYGRAISALQQAKRLDPHEYPEWLLFECESGIMIREVQQQIARQMIDPPSNQNAVMQLSMGEGKSSVIVPIVTAALSNGSQLVCVIVAKPQAKQMFQFLVSKLSGLLDRPVYQLPFSDKGQTCARCDQFGITQFGTASLQEEQLSPETETEREVERPPVVQPALHSIHPGLRYFIKSGQMQPGRWGFTAAFMALSDTTAARHLDVSEFHAHIWVTDDFVTSVQAESSDTGCSDLFQRPVQRILTSTSNDCLVNNLVIISPYEVNEMLPEIKASPHVTLHLYSPRINLGYQSLDHLALYSVPHRPTAPVFLRQQIVHLNLLAGQLYLSSFQEYVDLCNELGLAWSTPGDLVTLQADGFIPPGSEDREIINVSGFTKSPVKFIKVLMERIRQNGKTIEKTHVGKILDGVLLTEENFEED
ncbi:hypothetical protein AK830_g12007 [Neonectria ditissima]|uniref:ubiquitinyl hydrolase 1 n=1 Tax=Neonectria ditissima TaxID=78410 RepID=A0A0P7ABL7_9HYPO|nr:hypothetical protein AK830_g12007 [Neonectria ditissima]